MRPISDRKYEPSERDLHAAAVPKYAALKRAVEDAGVFAPIVVADGDGDHITCASKRDESERYTGRTIFVSEARGRWYFAAPHPYHYCILDSSRIEQAVIAFLGGGDNRHAEIAQINSEEYEHALARR
jgi:hypothetical protein